MSCTLTKEEHFLNRIWLWALTSFKKSNHHYMKQRIQEARFGISICLLERQLVWSPRLRLLWGFNVLCVSRCPKNDINWISYTKLSLVRLSVTGIGSHWIHWMGEWIKILPTKWNWFSKVCLLTFWKQEDQQNQTIGIVTCTVVFFFDFFSLIHKKSLWLQVSIPTKQEPHLIDDWRPTD